MRKKRRKAVYVPYDYEAAYKNSLDKMEEANEERILKEGKVEKHLCNEGDPIRRSAGSGNLSRVYKGTERSDPG